MMIIDKLKSFFNLRKTGEDREPELRRIAYNPQTISGVVINSDEMLKIATVWACVRYLSQTVAGLPWNVMRPVEGKGQVFMAGTVADRHPVNYVLNKRPSDEQSSFGFRETMMGWLLRYGNGYAEIVRDSFGRVQNLILIHPHRVHVRRDMATGKLWYEVSSGWFGQGQLVRLEPSEVYHVRGFGEGAVGLSVVDYAAETLGHSRAAQIFGAAFFGSGANPSGIITMAKPLTEEGLTNLEKKFKSLYKGPIKSNGVMFLDNNMNYQQLSIDPDSAQFVETNQHLVEEVCRWFGVPPHKVQHLLRATFTNIEHQSIEVVTDVVKPWVQRFNDEAEYKLLGNTREALYCQMDFTSLLRGDTTARMTYYRELRNLGVLSVNEIRAMEGMDNIGADGNKRVMQSQYTTLEMVGKEPVKPAPIKLPEPELDDDPVEEKKEPKKVTAKKRGRPKKQVNGADAYAFVS